MQSIAPETTALSLYILIYETLNRLPVLGSLMMIMTMLVGAAAAGASGGGGGGHHQLFTTTTATVTGGPSSPSLVQGYHVDRERCSGRVVDNATLQISSCAQFLGSLTNVSATLASMNEGLPSKSRLQLAVDAFPWWICPEASSCRPPYCACLNITFQGASKSVAEHVVDIADEIVLMGYTTQAQLMISHALPLLELAAAHSPPRRVRVGVAISGCVAGYRPPHSLSLSFSLSWGTFFPLQWAHFAAHSNRQPCSS